MILNKIKGRVLYQDAGYIIVSLGFRIFWYRLHPFSSSPFRVVEIPCNFFQLIICRFSLLQRLLRMHISLLIKKRDLMVIAFSGSFFILRDNNFVHLSKHSFSQPLVVAANDHFLFYGDYTSNKSRSKVSLRSISLHSGVETTLHNISGVRHIHGVVWDGFSEKFIVTTGDSDSESSLLIYDSNFQFLEHKINCGQMTRSIDIVPFADCWYYGTDTPVEGNYLVRVDKFTFELQKICKLPSSCFQISEFNHGLLLSCVPEPSSVNQTESASVLYYSFKYRSLQVIRSAKASSLDPKFFTYARIVLPAFSSRRSSLLFTSDHASVHHQSIHCSSI